MSQTRLRFRIIWYPLVLLILVSFWHRADMLLSALGMNLESVDASRSLLTYPHGVVGSEQILSAVDSDKCVPYPELLVVLSQLEQTDQNTALKIIGRNANCLSPGRQELLVPLQSHLLAAVGRHQENCENLTRFKAKLSMLELAKLSSSHEDWSTVELYLTCIDNLRAVRVWDSPFEVSQLYFQLGKVYESNGQTENALAAYSHAIAWNPVVWATLYIAKARLLWQENERSTAINLLLSGLRVLRARPDVTASVGLWYQLGLYWEDDGQLRLALCAYQHVQKDVGQVAENNFPEQTRTSLANRIHALQATQSPQDCNAMVDMAP
jgi:tetratricopeptide (TPR) repeat protein